jgi:molecular chaperone DnaK (HSP70)
MTTLMSNKPVVVAMDFGTSSSGIAFAHSRDPSSVIFSAPCAESGQIKVPTVLLRLNDGNWLFGNEAEQRYHQELMKHIHTRGLSPAEKFTSMQFFRGYKMTLKDLDGSDSFDSIMASAANGDQQPLLTLVFLSLWFLKNHALDRIRKTGLLENEDVASSAIQWVVTIPAIWNDFAKAFMRKAAVIAGLIDCEDSSDLILALEPECAAIACHLKSSSSLGGHLLREGVRFLVVDCGGGTIDLAGCEVNSLVPFQMSVIQSPQGCEGGGENVNQAFKWLLNNLLKDTFNNEATMPLAFHNIMKDFERLKCSLQLSSNKRDSVKCMINLREILDDPSELEGLIQDFNNSQRECGINLPIGLENRNGYLILEREALEFLFQPTLVSIQQEITKSLKLMPSLDFILLVGGFGSSDPVFHTINEHFGAEVSIYSPPIIPTPQAAILKGAVLYGFQPSSVVLSRVAHHTYGIKMYPNRFRKIITVGDLLPVGHEVEVWGIPVYPDQFMIEWKLLVTSKVNPLYAHEALELGKVTAYCPPGEKLRDRKQRIKLKFGGTEITTEIVNTEGTSFFGKLTIK